MTNEEVLRLKDEYDALDKEVQRLSIRRASVWKLMRDNCTHPTTIKKSETTPGSYYDRGYTEYYDECTTCKARLNIKTVMGCYG